MVAKQSEETRQRILAEGAKLVHLQGFNNTGLAEILKAAEVPKGSFYFYFKNKEAFGLALVDHHMERFRALTAGTLGNTDLPPLQRLSRFLDWFIGYYRDAGYSRGCPMCNLAQEMGDLSPAFRTKLQKALDGIGRTYAALFTEAQERGELAGDLDPDQAARFLVHAWSGALMKMKVEKTDQALVETKTLFFSRVLGIR